MIILDYFLALYFILPNDWEATFKVFLFYSHKSKFISSVHNKQFNFGSEILNFYWDLSDHFFQLTMESFFALKKKLKFAKLFVM